jgi:hypothetical protein
MSQGFAYLPLQALTDHRLGLIDLRVLGAVYSFGSKPGDVVWPSRALIASRCGYCDAVVSRALSRLVKTGWIERKQNRGPNHLTLLVPETVTYSVTVTESVTVTDSYINSDRTGLETMTDSVTPEYTKNRPENRPISTVLDASASQMENKQPAGASTGGQGGHEGEQVQPAERTTKKRKTPQAIHADWQPDERCWELLEHAGIGRTFAEPLLGEFRLYWEERGDKRPGWGTTFINHAKAQWKRQQERQQGGTNVTPLRPLPSGHRNGGGNFRTFEQMRAENSQRAIDEFLYGDNVGAIIDV